MENRTQTPQKLAGFAADWVKRIGERWVVTTGHLETEPIMQDPRLSDVLAVAKEIARQMNCE